MIDERQWELINLAVDGEVDAHRKAELEQLLERSEEARELYADLQSVDGLLRSLPEEELPADLHERIVGAIPPAPAQTRPGSDGMPVFIRYGLAASIGLMIAVAFYEGRSGFSDLQAEDVIGTIAPRPDETADSANRFAVEALDGLASLQRSGDRHILDIRFDGEETVEVVIDLSDSGLQFEALARVDGQPESLSVTGTTVRLRGRGQTRIAARLRGTREEFRDDAVVRIDYSSDGTLIHRGELAVD